MFRKIAMSMMFLIMLATSASFAQEAQGIRRISDLQIDLWVNKGEGAEYYLGEDVAIYFQTDRDAYVVVYDIDPAGNLSLLFPGNYNQDCYVRANEVYRIPDTDANYSLEISGPRGTEYVYAVASYNYIRPPDFVRYAAYDYSDWDQYYDGFVYKLSGDRASFAADLNRRIVDGPYVQAVTSFYIDDHYRNHRWYRHWQCDPYDVGSAWIGADWPGCEVWIDGYYWGLSPVFVPCIYVGRHWVWIYYNGYPYWSNYVYVSRGQRCHVDVKIKNRGDFGGFNGGGRHDYRGGDKTRRWDLKHDRHLNGRDFRSEMVKHPSNPPPKHPMAPARIKEKYSRDSGKYQSEDQIRISPGKAGSIDTFRPGSEAKGIDRNSRIEQKNDNENKIENRWIEDRGDRRGESAPAKQPIVHRGNKANDDKPRAIAPPQKSDDNGAKIIEGSPQKTNDTSSPAKINSGKTEKRDDKPAEKISQPSRGGKR